MDASKSWMDVDVLKAREGGARVLKVEEGVSKGGRVRRDMSQCGGVLETMFKTK